jgi:hypothetical protein
MESVNDNLLTLQARLKPTAKRDTALVEYSVVDPSARTNTSLGFYPCQIPIRFNSRPSNHPPSETYST